MKINKSLALMTAIAAVAFLLSSCGGIKMVDGDLGFLKGQAKVKIQYDYSKMGVGKFDREEDYLDKKIKEYNDKEPGKGDSWAKAWRSDRTTRFQPKFEELFNKITNPVNVSADPGYDDAKYTMIIHTIYTEPGYNVYISRKNAHINVEISFIETKNPMKVLAKLRYDKVEGRSFGGYDFDTGTRLSESYAKLGKDLAKYLRDHF